MPAISTVCRSGAMISLICCCAVAIISLLALMYMAGNASFPALIQQLIQEKPVALESAPRPMALDIASAAESQIHYPLAYYPLQPTILYNHLPKAGGSFIRAVLKEVVPKDNLRIEAEFT